MSDSPTECGSKPDEAARLVELREELSAIYAELAGALELERPVCLLSGRCCRFESYGHTLFVSAPEMAVMLADAPAPARELDEGATCPWQDAAGRCTARDARPMGCRIYFCDVGFQEQMPGLAEEFTGKLKALADRLGWAWDYAPLHRHLKDAASSGRYPPRRGASAGKLRTPD